ncbi:protein FAM131A isoform X2 [Anguilla anguilla]|uniref:protein FAM131A isoform X2 n=1 Tax=Anguilla anguilla TaxID=7936 RepID=UPI0015AF57A0|nr:protein FAM131A isoform X2 [Anguilla anguilla]
MDQGFYLELALPVDRALRVDWSAESSFSDLTLLGNTRTCLARRLLHRAVLESWNLCEVNVEDTVEMLPKSRRALTIQEIAALARSSLHGISQVVKDHVTKPTAMAQGRVAHLIEWKGWCKPTDSPAALESDFNSYSDLSEGEQEARFAAGVAEQFAIAEAKLRAWSSVDGDDSNDDSYDEDFPPANEPPHTTQSTDTMVYPHYLRDLLHSHVCQRLVTRAPCEGDSSAEPSPAGGSPDTLCSSLCSLEDHPLLRDLGCPPATPADLAAKILGALQGGEELLARLQRAGGGDCAFRSLGRGRPGDDSSFSISCSESFLSPAEDDDLPCKDYESVCRDVPPAYAARRKVSDVASSGVVSLDDEEEEEDEVEEEEDEGRRERGQ